MHSKQEFKRSVKKTRRVERAVVSSWLALSLIGAFWAGALQKVFESRPGVSYNSACAITAIMLLGLWTLPPLSLFYLRTHAGLVCPHCGPFRTPFKFPSHALRHDRCPRCNTQILDAP
jgi:hypothetical protein